MIDRINAPRRATIPISPRTSSRYSTVVCDASAFTIGSSLAFSTNCRDVTTSLISAAVHADCAAADRSRIEHRRHATFGLETEERHDRARRRQQHADVHPGASSPGTRPSAKLAAIKPR